jgi:hypothetical protein
VIILKKQIALITLLAINFIISGCGNNQVHTENSAPVVTESIQDSAASDISSAAKNEDNLIAATNEVQLSKDEKRKLNIFFSNFSEVYLQPFKRDQISNQQLICFGFYHNYKNNWNLFKNEGQSVKLDSKYVEGSVNYFFGKTVKHESVDQNLKFKDGYYYHPAAFGDPLPFSQVKKLIDLGDNYYLAYVDNYNNFIPGDKTEVDKFYDPIDEWYAQNKDSVKLIGKMNATVKKISENGNTRYILIDYLKAE